MPKHRTEPDAGDRSPDPDEGSPARRLTQRQIEILRHVAMGRTNREIGVQLNISPLTVRNHMRSIQRKLETSDRTHAVVMAIGSGLIPIPIPRATELVSEGQGAPADAEPLPGS